MWSQSPTNKLQQADSSILVLGFETLKNEYLRINGKYHII